MAQARTPEEVKQAFPYIPPRIDINYLCSNGKLLEDETIDFLKEKLRNFPSCRISKNAEDILEIPFPYGIIKDNDGIYAIYREEEETFLIPDVPGGR